MSDPRTIKKNLLQDLMQRARASTHSGSGGVKLLTVGSQNSSLRGSRSSIKSPKGKSPRLGSKKLHLPSVFKSHKDTLSPGDTSKSGPLKENSKRGGSRYKRSKSPLGSEEKLTPQKINSPLTKQQEAELEERRDSSLREKVLQLVKERRSTPTKQNSETNKEDQRTQHVLYTTYTDNSLTKALRNNDGVPVIPWKTTQITEVSPGKNLTQVSYCTSCGHIGEKSKQVGSTHRNSSGSADGDSLTNCTDYNKQTTLSNTPKVKVDPPAVAVAELPTAKGPQQKRSPLVRCNSVPNDSPSRIDPEAKVLLHQKEVTKQAKIGRSPSLRAKPHLVRRHTDLDLRTQQELDSEEQIALWQKQVKNCIPILPELARQNGAARQQPPTVSVTTLAANVQYCSEKYITYPTAKYSASCVSPGGTKGMMPKLRNGGAGNIYPLLKTKIPEEYIQEDGSVTFRKSCQEGIEKTAEVDRDSGVDIDNGGKQLYRADSNDSDFESNQDAAMTPDSVLEPSSHKSKEFDFNTLKKAKQPSTETADLLSSEEDNGTLTRHSTTTGESREKWDMYALLKRFEFVEWNLKPADNLKRQTLDLDNCNLDKVPAAVTEIEYYAFRDVEAVSLNHNEKIENADVLGKLADLRIINMWGCSLKSIPQTWSRLTRLQMLGLGNNRKLNDFAPLKHLTNIIWLDLGGCGLKRIPDEVTNMMKLKVLALGGNPGIDIGDEICSLWDLKKLGLNDCDLEEIPKSVFSLIKLTHLHLDNNFICHIDQEIVQLVDLEELTVTGNEDISFPKLLSQCDTIQCIVVDACKDLSRISGTLKSRMKTMPTATSPVKLPPPTSKYQLS